MTIDLGNIMPIGNSITEGFDVHGIGPNFDTAYGIQYELFSKFAQYEHAEFTAKFIGNGAGVINNRFHDCYLETGQACSITSRNTSTSWIPMPVGEQSPNEVPEELIPSEYSAAFIDFLDENGDGILDTNEIPIVPDSAHISGNSRNLVDYNIVRDVQGDVQSIDTKIFSVAEPHPDYPIYPTVNGQSFDGDPNTWGPVHNGWGGITSQKMASTDHLAGVQKFLEKNVGVPDIALIHLGTNDPVGMQAAFDTVANIETIINLLREGIPGENPGNQNVTVFVGLIIPRVAQPERAVAINANILAQADTWSTPTSNVIIVDHNSDFLVSGQPNAGLYWDDGVLLDGGNPQGGVHPTRAGEQLMAENWFNAIIDWKRQDLDGTVDFNGDQITTGADIDLLFDQIAVGSTDLSFDLDGNAIVDFSDAEFLVHEVLITVFGDANLDGFFNSGDLILVFVAGLYDDGIVGNASWETGDWTGDDEFDSSDLVQAFVDGGYVDAGATLEDILALFVT